MLNEHERVQNSMGRLVGKYVSDEGGLGIPTYLARFDHEAKRLVATEPEAARSRSQTPTQQQIIVKEEERRFLQALRDYEKNAKPKYKTGLDIDGKHTLAEVWKILDRAVEKYEDADKVGIWGRVRRAFRGLGQNGQAIQQWLGVVPSESNYLSVVCGGFKLILGAAERMKDIRDAALAGVHDIPVLLNGAQRVLGIYTNSQRLGVLSDALYAATLTSLGHILHYIGRNVIGKTFAAVFKQTSFQKDLKQSLDDMQKCRDDFNEEVRICGIEMQGQMEKMMQAASNNTENIQADLLLMQRFMFVAHNEYVRTQELVHEEAVTLRESMASMRAAQEKQQATMDRVVGMMMSNPLLNTEAVAMNQPLDGAHVPLLCFAVNSPHKPTGQEYSPGELRRIVLSRLDYDAKRMQTDVQENYEYGTTMPLNQQDRCVYVLTSVDLVSWIKFPTSRILVVNGNLHSTQFRSPLSFLSARLVYTLDLLREGSPKGKDEIAAVHFFCGEHADRGDKMNTAAAIINNLLAQLLLSFKHIDLASLIKLGDFQSDNLDAVCKRFKRVLKLLPSTAVVFCVIDNLPFYLADENTSEDAQALLRWLIRLTNRQRKSQDVSGGGCTFKLLLTAAVQYMDPETSALADDEVLNIPVTVPQTGGFTDMKWEMGVGAELSA
ncbi:hypothetical protein BDW62DRAFT_183927 [Aspergillus aurantiobrunneus]